MKNQDLQRIIDELETSSLKEDAYFGIFQYGGGPDESYIRANKQGLRLFALDLLKAEKDSDKIASDKKFNTYVLDYEAAWVDNVSDTIIQYIEPSIEGRIKSKPIPYQNTVREKIVRFGCIVGFFLIIVTLIVGVITIVKTLFF